MRNSVRRTALAGMAGTLALSAAAPAQTPDFAATLQRMQQMQQQQAAVQKIVSIMASVNASVNAQQVDPQFQAFMNHAIQTIQAVQDTQIDAEAKFLQVTQSTFQQFEQQAASSGDAAMQQQIHDAIVVQQQAVQQQAALQKFAEVTKAAFQKNNEDLALQQFIDSEDARHAQQDLQAKLQQMGDGGELSGEADQTNALVAMENPDGAQQQTAAALSALQQADALDSANLQALLEAVDGGAANGDALQQADALDRQNVQGLLDAINGVVTHPGDAAQALQQMDAADRANEQQLFDAVNPAQQPSLQQTIDQTNAAVQDLLRQVQSQGGAERSLDRNLQTLLDQGDLSDGAEDDILATLDFGDLDDAGDALRDQLRQMHDTTESTVNNLPLVDGLDNTSGSDLDTLSASIQAAMTQLAANQGAYEDSDVSDGGSYAVAQLQSIYQGYDPSLHGSVLQSPELQVAGPSLAMQSPDLQPAGPSSVMQSPDLQPAGPSSVMTTPTNYPPSSTSSTLQPALCGR